MVNLNQLFTLKKIIPLPNSEDSNSEEKETQVRVTYYQSGFGAAQKAMGNPINFKACLQNVYTSFEEQCRKQKEEQENLKKPYEEEKVRNQSELKNLETAISIFEEKKIETVNKINEAKKDIEEVKNKPEKFGLDISKKPKAQFYIGLFLLLPITIYLFVFYISATYSAFFKEFSNDSLTAAIFDAQAFNNAMKAGWLEGILVITIPSVFLGLGFIIHMIQKGKGIKNTIRLVVLFITTFLFDGLLAYQIEKKIYEFNKTTESAPYNLKIALSEAEFWMIIFAGFVVYIIWGLVFDITMKEYENIDKINGFITSKQEELKNLEHEKTEITEKINDYLQKTSEIKGKIIEIQNKIDGFILPVKKYLHYHNQYKEGWFQAIVSEIALPHERQKEILENCENISIEHLKSLDLLDPSFQHLIYSKIS
ncbi:ABC transporter permease [Cloacibacterium sp.]|uniref:ABC transporter permease n=1 Tax=Cloacibacterium sp. TaxID=1913682 RepID=UPI0039E36560